MDPETYFRFPDQMVLVSKEHVVDGPCTFKLILTGKIKTSTSIGERVFWFLEPNFESVEFELTEDGI